VFASKSNGAIAAGLLSAIILWGANNTGVKFLVAHWPPVFIGCSRMFVVATLIFLLLRWTGWFGKPAQVTARMKREFWLKSGLTLAVYVMAFTFSLRFTSASHVAVYLGTSPVWALVWEARPERNWNSLRRYLAALLALAGSVVLMWPKLQWGAGHRWFGDVLAICAALLWTVYSRQCRALGAEMSGAEITAQTMVRAATWMIPLALLEIVQKPPVLRLDLLLVQGYCVVGGGILAFALWNNALRHWPTSQVFLFGNLIPASTMLWAWLFLREPVTSTFWLAMTLVVAGVVLGQANWQKLFGSRWLPSE
jgi:drug/metabolite transporter (DMT)-like permease